MIGRSSLRSTPTPATFIDTSSAPLAAPAPTIAIANPITECSVPRIGRTAQDSRTEPTITEREPKRSTMRPDTAAVISMLAAITRSVSPSWPGPARICAASAGTRGAHEAFTAPHRPNATKTATPAPATPATPFGRGASRFPCPTMA